MLTLKRRQCDLFWCCRLLGNDVLQLTNSLNPNNVGARVHFVTNDDLRYMQQRNDIDGLDDMFLDPFYSENASVGSGVLSGVPTALSRWTEESHVLDGDSMHDCVTGEWQDLMVIWSEL